MSSVTHTIPETLLQALRQAQHVVVFSGAGISAESGVPTFRDAQTGLWSQFRAEDLATADAYRHDKLLVWRWYQWRRQLLAQAQPNAGHHAIAALEQRVPQVTVITQNVDDLHQQSGSTRVLALHGNLRENICFACRRPGQAGPSDDTPPRCLHCGGSLRPNVVWFGEQLPTAIYRAAEQAAADCDLFLIIGTSGLVMPAASLPRLAQRKGATIALINTEATAHQDLAQHTLLGPSGTWLPALLAQAWPANAQTAANPAL